MRISDWSSDVCSSDLLARVAIVLPEMDAVGAEPFGEADAVVDDERHVARAADFQERLGKARRLMLIDLFDAELERRHRPGIERAGEPLGKPPGHTTRRDKIQLARLGRVVALETPRKTRAEHVVVAPPPTHGKEAGREKEC